MKTSIKKETLKMYKNILLQVNKNVSNNIEIYSFIIDNIKLKNIKSITNISNNSITTKLKNNDKFILVIDDNLVIATKLNENNTLLVQYNIKINNNSNKLEVHYKDISNNNVNAFFEQDTLRYLNFFNNNYKESFKNNYEIINNIIEYINVRSLCSDNKYEYKRVFYSNNNSINFNTRLRKSLNYRFESFLTDIDFNKDKQNIPLSLKDYKCDKLLYLTFKNEIQNAQHKHIKQLKIR